MHQGYFCTKKEIGSCDKKTNDIECYQQHIIGFNVSTYRNIASHQPIKKRTIPTDNPLSTGVHE